MCYGLAAIAASPPPHGSFLSLMSVGGIGTPHHSQQNQSFVGLIDYLPANAQRTAGEVRAPKQALQRWLSEQASLLVSEDATDSDRIYASYSLCDFCYDPKDVIRSIVVVEGEERKFWRLAELAGKLDAGTRLVFPTVELTDRILDPHVLSLSCGPNVIFCVAIQTGAFNDAELVNGAPRLPISLIGVIHRNLVEEGRTPKWILHERTYQSLFGPGDYLELRV